MGIRAESVLYAKLVIALVIVDVFGCGILIYCLFELQCQIVEGHWSRT